MNNHNIPTPAQFAAKIATYKTKRGAQNAAAALVESMLKIYRVDTVKSYLTKYRKAAKAAGIIYINDYLKVPQSLSESRTAEKIGAQKKRLESRRTVENPAAMVAAAVELLEAKSYLDRCLGLALLTGRRTIEVMKIGRIKAASPSLVIFEGQAKKNAAALTNSAISRKSTAENEPEIYAIPVLHNAEKLAAVWAELQAEKDFLGKHGADHEKTTRAYAKDLRMKCKARFSDYLESPKPHDLRKVYAQICYHTSQSPEVFAQDYVSKILGHEKEDTTTGRAYMEIVVKNTPRGLI